MILQGSWCWHVTLLPMEWVPSFHTSTKYPDEKDRPIAFASRSIAAAERNYSQLEKEGLAIVFGVKKFHQYLFGRHFTITSDHKPLQHLFKETSPTPPLASARIQRWAQLLGGYDYSHSVQARTTARKH